jgi:RimJ/RimL family protein N-acetyltransferase
MTAVAYKVVTPRLVLRCWQPSDASRASAAIERNLAHLRPWMPWTEGEPMSIDDRIELFRKFRAAFDLGQDFIYGIFDPGETEVLGGTGLHPRVGPGGLEIGYWITAEREGQGLASETAAALTRVAFEVARAARVEIHCTPRNLRSAAVPRRLGFTHEATLRRRLPAGQGALEDRMVWTMFPEELAGSAAAALAAPVRAFDAAGRRLL